MTIFLLDKHTAPPRGAANPMLHSQTYFCRGSPGALAVPAGCVRAWTVSPWRESRGCGTSGFDWQIVMRRCVGQERRSAVSTGQILPIFRQRAARSLEFGPSDPAISEPAQCSPAGDEMNFPGPIGCCAIYTAVVMFLPQRVSTVESASRYDSCFE